jgi:hypothetical protein
LPEPVLETKKDMSGRADIELHATSSAAAVLAAAR